MRVFLFMGDIVYTRYKDHKLYSLILWIISFKTPRSHSLSLYIYIYIHTYIYIFIYIYIYTHIYIFIYIIIIIMSRRLRGYPWPSLAISPYHSSPPAGLQGYIPCPHIAAVCKFVLVVPLLHIHVWGSTHGVHRLWARPCFSSSVLRVWFVELV